MELKKDSRIFIDTAPIIYFIEENAAFSEKVTEIFAQISGGNIEAVTSAITFIEVLTKPYKMGQIDIVNIYRDFFFNSMGFNLISITPDIAELSAKIRADFGFKLPDAIQLAVFEYTRCNLFVTNDEQLKKYDCNRVYVLSQKE